MKSNFTNFLLSNKLISYLIAKSKAISLPGFDGISIFVVSKYFLEALVNGSLNMRASSLAFNFFLALFPSIIFLFTLIPYIPIDNFQDNLFELMQILLPENAFKATEETIQDILDNPKGGLLSFGFIAALYFSTNGFSSMIDSFNKTFHSIEERSILQNRLISLIMVIISTLLISIAIGLIIFSNWVIKSLELGNLTTVLIQGLEFIILFTLCLFSISFHYYLGPRKRENFKFISPGSLMATTLTILASLLFTFYVNNFANYNKLYGSIGTLIVIMLWILIVSFILLLGFDLNTSINQAQKSRSKELKPLE